MMFFKWLFSTEFNTSYCLCCGVNGFVPNTPLILKSDHTIDDYCSDMNFEL